MKEKTKTEMKEIYNSRREKLVSYMQENKITAVVFEDSEEHREPSIRYFTGHPTDALYIITVENKSVLIPWDINLAELYASTEKIIPSSEYGRKSLVAVKETLKSFHLQGRLVVEISPTTSYPSFLKYVDTLDGWDVRCRENSAHDYVKDLRIIKDSYEIECTKEAARIGDIIIEEIENRIKNGKIKTETDVALFIEEKCRQEGCERTGFETLAAGPARSFAIHCFPNYTSGAWPETGLSILDFGVVYNGYTSDTTLGIAKGPLSKKQEELISLVQEAADKAVVLYKKDNPMQSAAKKADEIFAAGNRSMPHTLGHGIGLEIHEYPRISSSEPESTKFKPGMILTLEPGLYDPELGGIRLENDILITEEGNEVITHSKIIHLE